MNELLQAGAGAVVGGVFTALGAYVTLRTQLATVQADIRALTASNGDVLRRLERLERLHMGGHAEHRATQRGEE